MQSNAAKSLAVALLIAVIAVFIVIASGDDDETESTDEAAVEQIESPDPVEEPTQAEGKEPEKEAKPAKPEIPTIVYRDGEVEGGVQDLRFDSGKTIEFIVRSDVADEVHLHGYDVSKDVEAGGKVKFSVPADIEGIFELELETLLVQLASVRVEP